MQMVKPTARPIRHGDRIMWRVTFPDSKTGYIGSSIEKATRIAFKCRLALMLSAKLYETETIMAVLP